MLILFNKPWGVLSQFSDAQGRPTLADFIDLPGVYPAGRLDRDSEGLLLLTDDGKLQHRIASPAKTVGQARVQAGARNVARSIQKTYLVQVEGIPGHAQLTQLKSGVQLKDGLARAVRAEVLPGKPGWLWPRDPPIRQRKTIPVSWLSLTLDEGRNRQVRRMTAAVGLPTLRLVRVQIGPWSLEGLPPGSWRQDGQPATKRNSAK